MVKQKAADHAVYSPQLGLAAMLRKLAKRSSVVLAPSLTPLGAPLCLVHQGTNAGSVIRSDFDRARRAGFVEQVSGSDSWRLSAKGREAVRRLVSSGPGCAHTASIPEKPCVDLDESPLAWLRRRRAKDGSPLITEAQFLAGERLRTDFTFAQLGPRVTANWDAALGATAGPRGAPGGGVDMADNVIAAAARVNRALHAVGPELSGILVDVCCFLKGLEELERSVGWPQRSGKVVLQIALTCLARHYHFFADDRKIGPASRHWGVAGYRPSINSSVATPQPAAD